MALLLGYDIGSSSVKAALIDAQTGKAIAKATSPDRELEIKAAQAGWAEQDPATWWEHVRNATAILKENATFDPSDIKAIGISYQMHGLVAVDKDKQVLRPSIIWCDSRAVQIGETAAKELGEETCLSHMLNLPGNFTASKLKWVKENEPQVYAKIDKIMLPGDYIAMKMTDNITTTPSGLSEGIMWDFKSGSLAELLLEHYGFEQDFIADILDTFSVQGELTSDAAEELGLAPGTPIAYRGGDQPNNALSLGVLHPGEVAVTAGTSGVVYAVTEKENYDPQSRVNIFVHVNHAKQDPRYGVLLCVNGTGILNSWLKHHLAYESQAELDYEAMNEAAATVPIGCEGLSILPYGNGAERSLSNRNPGASVHGWNFNVHQSQHFFRAAQEGIVFAFNYGLDVMRQIGITPKKAKAGNANMFLSPLFTQAFATVTGTVVELCETDGAQGAALGAGFGAGVYGKLEDAFENLETIRQIEPDEKLASQYKQAYEKWLDVLKNQLQ